MTSVYSPPTGSRLMDRFQLETSDAVLHHPEKVRGLMEIDATQGRVTAHVIPALRALQRIVGTSDLELFDRWNTAAAELAKEVHGNLDAVFGNTIALGDTNGGNRNEWLALADSPARRKAEAVRRYERQLQKQSAVGIHQALGEAFATVEDAETAALAAEKVGMDRFVPSFQTNSGLILSYEENRLLLPSEAADRVQSELRSRMELVFGINCVGTSGGIAAVRQYPEFRSFHPNFLDFPDTQEGNEMRLLMEKDPRNLSHQELEKRAWIIQKHGITPAQMQEIAALELDFAGNCCGSTEKESAFLAECLAKREPSATQSASPQ